MEGPVLNTTILYLVQNSTGIEDNLINITQGNELNSSSGSERAAEIKRLIYVTVFSISYNFWIHWKFVNICCNEKRVYEARLYLLLYGNIGSGRYR